MGEGVYRDLAIRQGQLVELAPQLETREGVDLDARGGAVIRGLWDHHIHIHSLAASLQSVPCGPPEVVTSDDLASTLSSAAKRARPGAWIRGYGYHESVAGHLDRWRLDRFLDSHPLRVQHRSGRLWMLNSRAVDSSGLEASDLKGMERDRTGRVTGRLFNADAWLRAAVGAEPMPDLSRVGKLLAAAGVTGVTDATPDLDDVAVASLSDAVQTGVIAQRVCALGIRLGGASDGIRIGPFKIIVDEAAGIDFDRLVATISSVHRSHRAVAIHCVTRAEVVAAIAAISDAGSRAGDRLEHAAELPLDLDAEVKSLGLTIVTQPNFIAERGDVYRREVAETLDILWRCGSLLRRGIMVAAGTDAPFGSPDPWSAMQAAADRRTATGSVVGADERVSSGTALGLFMGSVDVPGIPLALQVGMPADLCVLRRPLAEVLQHPSRGDVRATIIGGRVVYDAESEVRRD